MPQHTKHLYAIMNTLLLLVLAAPILGLESPWGVNSHGSSTPTRSSIQKLYSHPPRGGNIVDEEQETQATPQPSFEFPEHIIEPKYGLLFIDRFCHYHGGYLAAKARDVYGVATINSLSTYVSGYIEMTAQHEQNDDNTSNEPPSHLRMTIPSPDELEKWEAKIPFEILGVICESDSGLEEAELIGEAMGVRFHNGFNAARRDKFLMNDVLSKKGMRVVKQRMCATLEEAIEFAKELGVSTADGNDSHCETNSSIDESGFESGESNRGHLGRASNSPVRLSNGGKYCVIKPKRGVASDDVQFCSNLDDVRIAFERVKGTSLFGSITGERNDDVVRDYICYA